MLHTVNKSPFMSHSFETCLGLASEGSDILLIEDGVYAAISGTESAGRIEQMMPTCKFYVLDADLKVRGIEVKKLMCGIEPVGYDGFVDLAVKNSQIQSWF